MPVIYRLILIYPDRNRDRNNRHWIFPGNQISENAPCGYKTSALRVLGPLKSNRILIFLRDHNKLLRHGVIWAAGPAKGQPELNSKVRIWLWFLNASLLLPC